MKKKPTKRMPKNATKLHKKRTKKKKPTKKEEQLRTKKGKELLLVELTKSHGNVTTACVNTGMDRKTYYLWMKSDKKFKQAVDDLPEQRLDFYEDKLDELCEAGVPSAVIYFLKTKGKKRGYVEDTPKGDTHVNLNLTKVEVKFKLPKEFKSITEQAYLPDEEILGTDQDDKTRDRADI